MTFHSYPPTRPRSASKQDWTAGQTVKVGFMTLEVVEKVGPDYRLWNPSNGKKYTFTPHEGIGSGWYDAAGWEI